MIDFKEVDRFGICITTIGTCQVFVSGSIHIYSYSKNGVAESTLDTKYIIESSSGVINLTHRTLGMSNVASTIAAGRVPWVSEPACVTCHTVVNGVSTGVALYRNSSGHGDLHCTACHGSPHAMYPSSLASDNYQSKQYQGFTSTIKSIGSCGVCHNSSRGESNINEFSEEHGGTNPGKKIGCHACHTVVPANTANWPHAFTWKNSNI